MSDGPAIQGGVSDEAAAWHRLLYVEIDGRLESQRTPRRRQQWTQSDGCGVLIVGQQLLLVGKPEAVSTLWRRDHAALHAQ